MRKQVVDGRDKPGHDEYVARRTKRKTPPDFTGGVFNSVRGGEA
jgi:hypothetical protein